MLRYNSYSRWLKERFGETVYKVSVNGGFTCPNRDGQVAWGGCTYCNNESFSPDGTAPDKSIEEQVHEGVAYLSRRFKANRFIVYWQNFSNTYRSTEELEDLYRRSLSADPRVVGLAIGTRPDCVETEKLEMISRLANDYYVCMEYGLESIFDETLERINRGHDVASFRNAVERTKRLGLNVCAHIILGFPWESREDQLSYPAVINKLGINFLKIHHLHIVEGTRMAMDYREEEFHLYSSTEWAELIAQFLERLCSEVVIQRLFGWAPENHLIAPKWGKSKSQLLHLINRTLESRNTWQGKLLEDRG